MRAYIAFLSAFLIAGCSQSDTGGVTDHSEAVTKESSPPKEWTASPFDPERDVVETIDLEIFFKQFKQNSDTLSKGEFETTEEHEARISHVEAFGTFVKDQPYAITVAKGSQIRYSADNEIFYPLVDRLCSYFDFPYTIDKNSQAACAIGIKFEGIQA